MYRLLWYRAELFLCYGSRLRVLLMIIENLSLAEVKALLIEQNLWNSYVITPTQDDWYVHTSPDGLDQQVSDPEAGVCAKFWIQYFTKSNQFALNISFFTTLDGAPVGSNEFIRLIPEAVKPYQYYNSEKIRWVCENDMYVKVKPTKCPFNLYPNILTITPIG
jgi:hypothetical protein